jgi:DNA (cytosine-5)-methyltransferase 1
MIVELKAIDLFSGCGGVTLGLKQAGFHVVYAVENDPAAISVFRTNHQETTVSESDIRDLSPKAILDTLSLNRSELDLLAGCPPCQGFSSLRTLNGSRYIDDNRNDLLMEYVRFVEGFLPKAIMMENVPGLLQNARFPTFLARMKELGYIGEPAVLDAADYGVPQRRRRLIYLAGRGFSITPPIKKLKHRTVADAIMGLPKAGESGDPLHDLPEKRSQKVIELIRRIPKNGGSRTDLPVEHQLACHKRCSGFKDVYGRMSWQDVAPTITSGCFNPSKGRFLHPEENRAITMREAALLQGFPMNYSFSTTKSKIKIARMIGNALPPPMIKEHAVAISDELQDSKWLQPLTEELLSYAY